MILALFLFVLGFGAPEVQAVSPQRSLADADRIAKEGDASMESLQFEDSLKRFREALEIYQQQNHKPGIADTLFKMGRINARTEKYPEALRLFEQARKIHDEIGDKKAVVMDMTRIAIVYSYQGNYHDAIALSEKALAMNRDVQDRDASVLLLDNLANSYFDTGSNEKALDSFHQALTLATEVDDKKSIGMELGNIGQVYWKQGDFPQAIANLEKAKEISEGIGDTEVLSSTICNLGLVRLDQGELTEAKEAFEKSMELFQTLGIRDQVAVMHSNIAAVNSFLGNYQQVCDSLQKTIEIAEEIGDQTLLADTQGKLASVYAELGNYEMADELLKKAMKTSQEIGAKSQEASTWMNLGDLYKVQGKSKEALAAFQNALRIAVEIKEKLLIADCLERIAGSYSKMGNPAQELKALHRALSIEEEVGNRAGIGAINMRIGTALYNAKRIPEADAALTKSIEILRDIGWLDSLWPALYRKGLIHRDSGNIAESIRSLKEAVDIIERLRGRVEFAEQKSAFFEERIDIYEDLIQLLVKQNDIAGAFEFVERAKARSFLDSLSEAHIDPKTDLTPEQFNLKRRLEVQMMNLNQAIREQYTSKTPDVSEVQRSKQRLTKLDEQYLGLMSDIHRQNPRFSLFRDPQPIQLQRAQQLIDSDTAIAEYFVGKEASLLFVVTSTTAQVFRLPPERVLTDQVRALLAAIQKPDPVYEASEQAYARYVDAAASLYNGVFKPGESLFQQKKKIVISPDGALSDLPFECLVTGRVSRVIDFSQLNYLARHFDFQYIPSTSVLEALRLNENRENETVRKSLIAFAAPMGDGRLTRQGVSDSTFQKWSSSISDLPNSKVEAEQIARLFPPKEVTLMVGKDASETTVKNINLSQYRMIHFASHGLIDEQKPQFSALLLYPGAGKLEDGFLTMREVFDLKLNADLVVLSACKTGLGRQIRGEGIDSLSRAFFTAGASNVIMSFWNVFDLSTAQFMTDFYGALLKNGSDKAAALREARLKMIDGKQFNHPYYWAPFILMGRN